MKQVVKVIENKVIDINSVDVSKYYGFIMYDGSAGQIVGEDMTRDNNYYQAKFFNDSTFGNPCSNKYASLKYCIDDVLNGSIKNKVFEFDSYQELFKWAWASTT